MRRIMVIGGPGAGKSTFCRELGARLNLPVIHMDQLFWEPSWTESNWDIFMKRVHAEIGKDSWIMDGNYSKTWPERVARADTVVFLDMPTWLRFWRTLRRTIVWYGTTRLDVSHNCPERFDFGFLFYWVLGYRWISRPKALLLMAQEGPAAHCVRHYLKGPRAVKNFFSTVL